MSNHSIVQLRPGTNVRAITISNQYVTTSTPEPTSIGRLPESPESSNLRLFGSTTRFFAPQDPFRYIASRFGRPTSRMLVGGKSVPQNLVFKLLHVYDTLRQTNPSNHELDVAQNAPSDVFELCAEVLAQYSPGDRISPIQAKNIIFAKRSTHKHVVLLAGQTHVFRHICIAATESDEFRQLVALYTCSASYEAPEEQVHQTISRSLRARQISAVATSFAKFKRTLPLDARKSLLDASQLLQTLSHTIIARINHFYRIPFVASQLALLLQRHDVADAVPAGRDYVVPASVYSCTVEYARDFLQGGWQAQVRGTPRHGPRPTFLQALSVHVRIRTDVTLFDEAVVAAILKEEELIVPSET